MIKVLDHGYVNYIEHWGSDERIIEAARMSTNKGFQGWEPTWNYKCVICNYSATVLEPLPMNTLCPNRCLNSTATLMNLGNQSGDMKLLRYLWEHKHHTPFEMAGLTIEVQAPIMVFREWHRHRTQSYNEMSGRYTELPNLYYFPSVERLMAGKQAKANKQSSESGFTECQANAFRQYMDHAVHAAREAYEIMLGEGVAREIARLILPVNQYSRMRASANLRNWLAFLSLRMATDAQWEIRQFANVVGDIINAHFPRTYQLFEETRTGR